MCKKTYQEKKEEHRCGACGKIDERTLAGKAFCEACAEKRKKSELERYHKNRDAIIHKRQNKRKNRKQNGLCVRCGKPTIKNHTYCDECILYIKLKKLEKVFKKWR